jgi:anti-sigma B factor antagonist
MTITTEEYKRCDLVRKVGRVDSSNADELHQALKAINELGRYKIVFDMGDVDFMSSKGWWVLIETQKACKRYNRGELVLANVSNKIRESLDLVGMSEYFHIFDDAVSAVGSF